MNWAKEKKLIDENEYKFLAIKTPQIPTFYALPKVHKGVNPLKGCPIVAGIGGLTQNVGIYIDKILRHFVIALPFYTHDTMDLLKKIYSITVEPNTILASVDVEALYSSISHDKGLEAVRLFLSTRGAQFQEHNNLILELLSFVLT